MSEALERVIAEQQAKIDRLEKQLFVKDNGWINHNKKLETFCESVFGILNHPQSEMMRLNVKHGLIGFNYCLTCEQAPCECEGQYD